MIPFTHGRRWMMALAVALLATMTHAQTDQSAQPQPAQRQAPLPLKPDLPGLGKNHRLILKDGSYQVVRQYEIAGDRVRYLSQERGAWEEMPVDLVDWDATRKWERDHATPDEGESSPAMREAAEIDREQAEVRIDQNARMPQVAEGLELPDQDGVFVLDTYRGTPELVELAPVDLDVDAKARRGLAALNPLAGQRGGLEIAGAHAKAHLHVNDPAVYLSLDLAEAAEPALAHPMTINTAGAKPAANGKHGAHSAQSGFAIVRVDERRAVRLVGAIHVSPDGTVTHEEDVVPARTDVLPGKRWLRIQPIDKLRIGEYALVEILSPSEISPTVWDFRVDPAMGDNPGSIGPILKRTDEP